MNRKFYRLKTFQFDTTNPSACFRRLTIRNWIDDCDSFVVVDCGFVKIKAYSAETGLGKYSLRLYGL